MKQRCSPLVIFLCSGTCFVAVAAASHPPASFSPFFPHRRRFNAAKISCISKYMREDDDSSTATMEELAESIMIDEVSNKIIRSDNRINSGIKSSQALSALQRAVEIVTILSSQVMAPILTSLAIKQNWPNEENGGWEAFWSTEAITTSSIKLSHAQRLASSLEKLGPTYVKFGQALGSRPDVVPPSLAAALSALQDDMEPFDNDIAKEIILAELLLREANGKGPLLSSSSSLGGIGEGQQQQKQQQALLKDVEALVSSLTEQPVAAASIGQVYKAHIPGKGDVAVKVQRPGVRLLVERDAELLLTVASFLESLPALPSRSDETTKKKQTRLINTELVSTTQEFMSRIFEELDYRKEASNIAHFGSLYSRQEGISKDVSVIVPKVYSDLCTENVLVMEWISGVKLTDVTNTGEQSSISGTVEENLALVKVAIDSTLSQLLVQGVLHADPHSGNLLKVRLEDDSVTLGYLDFGIVSTIPQQVRDALICSVALQVFSRDVNAVSSLFGELRLIPQHILDDEEERAALAEALEITFANSLIYPDSMAGKDGSATAIPDLKFDKLLDSLSRLVPRFQFNLPPYFINNARALSTLEGIAKSLDPSFNVLTVMYPYALSRLLRNPSKSEVVERTLQSLIRSENGKIDREKIRRLLRDSALISGQSKRRVIWDILKTKEGRVLARGILGEEIGDYFRWNDRKKELNAKHRRQKMKNKRWYYLEL